MKRGGNTGAFLDFFIYVPFFLLFIGLLWYFSSFLLKREGYGGGIGHSISNVGISTRVSRSGTRDTPIDH